MAKETPTTVEKTTDATTERKVTGAVINPRMIEFPFDQHGFTSMLRKEGVRAVGRIKGDTDKLSILLNTLRVLGEHAKAKIEDQAKDIEKTAAALKNRTEAEYARSLADQEAEVKRLKGLLKSAEAAVAAKKAMPGAEAASDE